MVNAVSNSVVPKFTVIMEATVPEIMPCAEKHTISLMVTWPGAELAIMGGTQAARILAQIEAASLKRLRIVDEIKRII
jgi:acetyl-CoA carboxylase carboxyltransferase component